MDDHWKLKTKAGCGSRGVCMRCTTLASMRLSLPARILLCPFLFRHRLISVALHSLPSTSHDMLETMRATWCHRAELLAPCKVML